jgi:hypothetical protein
VYWKKCKKCCNGWAIIHKRRVSVILYDIYCTAERNISGKGNNKFVSFQHNNILLFKLLATSFGH